MLKLCVFVLECFELQYVNTFREYTVDLMFVLMLFQNLNLQSLFVLCVLSGFITHTHTHTHTPIIYLRTFTHTSSSTHIHVIFSHPLRSTTNTAERIPHTTHLSPHPSTHPHPRNGIPRTPNTTFQNPSLHHPRDEISSTV